ncbi:ATP-grasp ribosomal peptide maturase [Kribbella aluminosa]|uniref:ATP-grasp ribosomal peptide maturase n=1 Tax=Kribbella aluminosa TaxID=416017 RepID=A0ABS4USK9_9ACTN|nr:ATP-grasp ribosomal peptide maturase [Kribbella aluminosa]MBP2354615.1 ATP-grasp ribosomal peptide maturase [Kribbella aluminosa]
MSDESAALVLTNPNDVTADLVVQKLQRSGAQVLRCDAADFPMAITLEAYHEDGWVGVIKHADRVVDLADIRGIYCRRPAAFRLPADMTDDEQEFATSEAQAGFTGVLMALPCRWINHPAAERIASYKPYQLRLASASGLVTPRSIITNNPTAARTFASEAGRQVIYKGIGRDFANSPVSTPAVRFVAPDEIDDSVRLTAHLFQEFVPKRHDIRLIVVGSQLFAVEIHAHSSQAALDWRTDYDALTYKHAQVPDEIRVGVAGLMTRLDLVFGVLDFVVGPDGRWYFLEINANGQWAWLPGIADLVACAIADELTTPSEPV